MPGKPLYIFVEGSDDYRFFRGVIQQRLEKKYSFVELVPYSQLKREKVRNWLRTADGLGTDCLIFGDIDNHPCVTRKKASLKRRFPRRSPERMVVVIQEIESWYIAGIDGAAAKKLKVKVPSRTDDFDKEQFARIVPNRFVSSAAFMQAILDGFSMKTAREKNVSFDYFCRKHKVPVS